MKQNTINVIMYYTDPVKTVNTQLLGHIHVYIVVGWVSRIDYGYFLRFMVSQESYFRSVLICPRPLRRAASSALPQAYHFRLPLSTSGSALVM